MGSRTASSSGEFYYETKMLRDWFKKTLLGDPK
jgi:hypothetical protein